ncbi:ATP-binding cassette domain-containing protein [Flavobacterium restrictum]|uniref:ATP-binding cassette domain-containing protein n=1 Tax=Flavobacterium restrictum TaxID=2594428 RepID=A0A553DR43_9FLAO|nr:ATP-binding cassette domain-containing protein [Flavobacterium restrictum]TRX35249.1 ATP-binding cassette domain-containing protein [Flavobacterium restrictum]
MKKHLLEIDSVQKNFDFKSILSDVYLKCETGDIIGILGRNGSGKSTLLQIIFGVIPANFKFIRVDGAVTSKLENGFRAISYLSQEDFIPKHFSVKKVLSLSLEKNKISDFTADKMIQLLLDKKVKDLSGGELRYLEIKLLLFKESKFVLLDEPYNGLSPIAIEKINALILENASAKGIIITDHNYENVITISTQLRLLKEGKLHTITAVSQLVEKGYLSAGMG